MFQSAPLTEARGDRGYTDLTHARRIVSIRSPHRSKGRHDDGARDRLLFDGFNPLPSQKQGETAGCGAEVRPRPRFNPLPSQKQGETGSGRTHAGQRRRFNPLPSQKQGETLLLGYVSGPCFVSIRSPHRSKGRPRGGQLLVALLFVSIRSPHRSKGRPRSMDRYHSRALRFNPLPSQKQGET